MRASVGELQLPKKQLQKSGDEREGSIWKGWRDGQSRQDPLEHVDDVVSAGTDPIEPSSVSGSSLSCATWLRTEDDGGSPRTTPWLNADGKVEHNP